MTMTNIIIYILCHNLESEEIAKVNFGNEKYARIIKIPQTHLFESVMYKSVLKELYHEWKDADFVGTIAYSYPEKFDISFLKRVLLFKHIEKYDFVSLIPTITDPAFNESITKKIFLESINAIGNPSPKFNQSYNLCNYWIARPKIMLDYIEFFNSKWLPAVESHGMSNSKIDYRLGSLSKEVLVKLTGNEYYSQHPFVHERLPSVFMNWNNIKQVPMILDAKYGNSSENKWVSIKNHILTMKDVYDFNESFGDPCPYHCKELHITYSNSVGLIERYVIPEGGAHAFSEILEAIRSENNFFVVY
jgi:hypothetical protein